MQSKKQFCNLISRTISRAATAALTIAIMFALTVLLTQSAWAQTLIVLHNFTGGGDGANPDPDAGLTMDAAGNLYGTTAEGNGTVFKLKRSGSSWILNTLYTFQGGSDGQWPRGRMAIAPDGTLYGTTWYGGGSGYGYGTVFHLKPSPTAPKTALAPWGKTEIHAFTGNPDGEYPEGELTFDPSGSIYGTTYWGGNGVGTVYELTPSGGGWTETVIYSPPDNGTNGSFPWSGVVFDKSGNLYGVCIEGGPASGICTYGGCGTVYQLSPSGPVWTVRLLYAFTSYYGADGSFPTSVITDPAGNLYGTTSRSDEGGTIFELTPGNGGWTFTTLHDIFVGGNPSPAGPQDRLVMDAAGDLYGTTVQDGLSGYGNVFKLAPSSGGWTYTDLYDFTGGSEGGYPSGVVMDAKGNLYGTTSVGGAYGNGVVFELTP